MIGGPGASEALQLLKLLDQTAAFNRALDLNGRDKRERQPEPDGTAPITADAHACAYVARQLGYPPEYVWETCAGMPVKRLRVWRDTRTPAATAAHRDTRRRTA